jgi:hypothetical protein
MKCLEGGSQYKVSGTPKERGNDSGKLLSSVLYTIFMEHLQTWLLK